MENLQFVNKEFYSQLLAALSSSLSNNNQVRQNGEQFIKQAQKTAGYCSTLLQMSVDPNVNTNPQININHIAAVQLGTLIEYHWKFKDDVHAKKVSVDGFDYIILDQADKQYVRENIMKCLYATTSKVVIKQIIRSITTIARFDYPEQWPTLLAEIMHYLNLQDEKAVVTGLQGLLGLCKKYEFEMDDEREPLFSIIEQSFGIMGNLINQLINFADNQQALEVLFLICKIFYVSNQLFLCPFLTQGSNIEPWIQFFKTIMDRPIPSIAGSDLESFCEDMTVIEERNKNIQWKLKGIASQTTYRLFTKLANKAAVDDHLIQFSEYFLTTCGLPLLESHLTLVFKRKTNFVGSKSLNFGIKYISAATKIPKTMEKLLPFIENLLYETVIPIMLISHKDVTLFTDDPIEYIRMQYDFTENIFTPKNSVLDLLTYLCQYKSNKKNKRPDFIHGFLKFCVDNLEQYKQQTNPDFRIKEAILHAIGHLEEDIYKYKELRNQMESMLITHVLPEFSNQGQYSQFLKMRACWIYGQLGEFKFKDDNHVKQAVDSIYQQLFSQDLPVRLMAATSIHKMLFNKVASEFLKPALKNILEIYLKLMSEIESEELVSALEEIVSHFKEDISPYAIELAHQLVSAYQRLIQVNVEEDDGESALAAVGCVTTIRRILDSVNENKELLGKLEEVVFPILMHGLTQDGMDAMEDALDCIALLLYYGENGKISASMWKLFPQLLYVICGDDNDPEGGYAFEFVAQIAVSIQNYISKDPSTFINPIAATQEGAQQPLSYLQMSLNFVKRVLDINRNSKHLQDGLVAMKVIIAMLENLQGKIDQALPFILQQMCLCLQEIQQEKGVPKNYKSMLLQTISMCFWYNSPLTFQILESTNSTVLVFQNWLAGMALFKKDFEIRRIIFGLTEIVKTNPANLPQLVGMRLPDITKQLVLLSLNMRKERVAILQDNEKYLEEEANKSFESASDDEDENNEGMDKEESDEEESYQKTLNQLKKARQSKGKDKKDQKIEDEEEEDEDSDSDYEYTGGDLALYDSYLDNTDELIYIKEAMSQISSADMNYYMNLVSQLNQDESNQFNEVMNQAEALKLKEEEVRKKVEELEKNNKE